MQSSSFAFTPTFFPLSLGTYPQHFPKSLFQACFAAELIKTENYRTLLLCVPVFRTTGTAVLVNLRTLEASTISFQMGMSGQGHSGTESESGGGMEVEVQ